MARRGRKPKAADDPAEQLSPVYKVKVPQAVIDRCEEGRNRAGQNYLVFFRRLLEFFAEQDEGVQNYMMGLVPHKDRVGTARVVLERIIAEGLTPEAEGSGGAAPAARSRESTGGRATPDAAGRTGSNPKRSRVHVPLPEQDEPPAVRGYDDP